MRYFLLSYLLLFPFLSFAQLNSETSIDFIANKGQWKSEVNFKANIPGATVWLESSRFTYDFVSQTDMDRVHELWHSKRGSQELNNAKIRHHAYKVKFVGANANVVYEGLDRKSNYHNYFLGDEESKWAGNVPLSGKVIGHSLYEAIDIMTYSKDGNFKYDFIVHPGGDPAEIKLEYSGADIRLLYKELVLDLSVGSVYEHAPVAYQLIKGKRKKVSCNYVLEGNSIRFDFPKGYNASYDLIIDPELIFSTYTGSTADNWGFTATYDEEGNLYGGGIVFNSGYPTTTGAYSEVFNGGLRDIGITKYTSDGSNQVYSTYLGGSGIESPHSLMVDNEGNLVLMGSTSSTNFPTTAGSYDESFNGGESDIVITKFNSDGSSLLASTFIGGSESDGVLSLFSVLNHNYGDEARGEVFIDVNDNIYVASVTSSNDFPTTDLSEEQDWQGGMDACVIVFPPSLDSLIFSTYLGGSSDDAAYSIKKKDNLLVVAGGTTSNGFPTTSSSLNPQYIGGSSDGFVLTLDSVGSIYNSSFIGTPSYDQVYFVEIDPEFHVFLTGQSEGAYPVSSGVYSNANGSQFVQEMSSELSISILSTVFGTGGAGIDISPTAFLVDQCDHVYISGWGGIQGTGSTTGLPITSDAFQSTTDGNDFYFIVFESNFEGLLYATYFGGNTTTTGEHVDGGTSRFDKDGIIYQAVCAGCGGSDEFPTTAGAWSQTNGSTNCNLGTLKMEFDFQGIDAEAIVSDTIFCDDPPFLVPFYGSGDQIPYHFWDFGDGNSSNEADPTHSYDAEGIYDIQYIVIDSNTCNISDTAYASVTITQKEAFSMVWQVTPPEICQDTLFVDMAFTGTGADSLIWDMDDGTVYYNDTLISHVYFIPGVYNATLTAIDLDCEYEEVISQTYILSDDVVTGVLDVPNIFSPNNDGKNDKFRLFNLDNPLANPLLILDFYHVEIYNRWGKKVFESGDSHSTWEWDGTIEGNKADEGVYYYILQYESPCETNGKVRKTGYITLVR